MNENENKQKLLSMHKFILCFVYKLNGEIGLICHLDQFEYIDI